MRLTFPDNAVVPVAGLPGAGSTTLIRRTTSRLAVQWSTPTTSGAGEAGRPTRRNGSRS